MVTFRRSKEHFRIVSTSERTEIKDGDQLTTARTIMLFVFGTIFIVSMSLRPKAGIPVYVIEIVAEILYFLSLCCISYLVGNIIAVKFMSLHYKHWSTSDRARLVVTFFGSISLATIIIAGYYTLQEVGHNELPWSIVLAIFHVLVTIPPLLLGVTMVKNSPEKYLIHP